jgi:hypothetical protein
MVMGMVVMVVMGMVVMVMAVRTGLRGEAPVEGACILWDRSSLDAAPHIVKHPLRGERVDTTREHDPCCLSRPIVTPACQPGAHPDVMQGGGIVPAGGGIVVGQQTAGPVEQKLSKSRAHE